MGGAPRRTGIDVVGDVPWGTHFCQFYKTRQDLLDVLVPYFAAGLAANERCMWVTSDPLDVADAAAILRRAVPDLDERMRRGQIEIVPHADWYLKGGSFDARRVLEGWVGKLEEGLAAGYEGLRATGNTAWLERKDWRSFAEYEAMVNGAIGGRRMLALCSYALAKCGAVELIEVARNHEFALIKHEGRWERVQSHERASREAEERLRRSERNLREAQRLAHVGSWELDLVHDVLNWSEEIYRIFEIDPREFRASYEAFLEVVHPDDRDAVDRSYRESVRQRKPYEVVHRLRMKDGRVKFAHERCETSYDDAGRALRSIGTVQDVTERTLVEQEVLRLNAQLEERVRLRTAELAAALDASRRSEQEVAHLNLLLWARASDLETANLELDAFVHSVTHDLRAPLAVIDGFSQALVDGYRDRLDVDGRDCLAHVREGARRMAGMIDDLLRLSRVSRAELSIEDVDLSELARGAAQELALSDASRRVEIRIPDGLRARGDAKLLRHVLDNLLGNAWKFTAKRERATIEVGVEEVDGRPAFFVRDDGVGFDMKDADRLFRPFQRLHEERAFPGTGVGLSIVQRVVQRHGGSVWAEGAPGRGATFWFTLDRRVAKQ